MTHTSSSRPKRSDKPDNNRKRQRPDALYSTALPAQIVVDSMTDLAALCDADGIVTYINPALATLLQDVPSPDVPLDDYAIAYRTYRPDGQLYEPRELPLQAAALTRQPQRNVEVLFRRPDGSTRLTTFNATPLFDTDGSLLGAVAIGRDVTDEYALAQAREDWLATAAHDLRGPVTAILGNLQLARRALALLAPEEEVVPVAAAEAPFMISGETALGTARAAAPGTVAPASPEVRLRRHIELAEARTRDLIRQMDTLLDAGAAAAGALTLHAEPGGVDVGALAEAAAEHARAVTTRHTIEVDVRTRPRVQGDQLRLRQVLDNLLANAIKYSPERSTIRLAVEEREGTDACRAPAGTLGSGRPRWAVVAVEDQGLGIPAADVPHVFERYRRASGAASRVRGTGLGLYSSRAIAEAHGGSLWVERTATAAEAGPDGWRGTVMALALPLDRGSPAGRQDGEAAPSRRGRAHGPVSANGG